MTVSDPVSLSEGFVSVDGFKTWFGVAGANEVPGRLPLLVIHGGPGLPHDYLEPLAALAEGRRVIFYDQLGCGRSDRPPAGYGWTTEMLASQIAETRAELGLDGAILLYGQSYGGILALEHVLSGGKLAGLVLADTAGSMPRAAERVLSLRGDDPSPEAQQRFMARHFIGGDGSAPEPVKRAFAGFGAECYAAIWGGGAVPSGPLKDWDVSGRLGEIAVPTLVINGRDDQLTPECGLDLHRAIAGSEFHIFEKSAHLPFWTELAEHNRVVGAFLRRVEGPPYRPSLMVAPA